MSDADRSQALWELKLHWQRKGTQIGLRSYSAFTRRPYVGLNVGIRR